MDRQPENVPSEGTASDPLTTQQLGHRMKFAMIALGLTVLMGIVVG